MHYQYAVLEAAASANVSPIAFQENIEGLLPQRPRAKMERLLPMAVYDNNESVYKEGMERVLFPSSPKEIIQRR